METAIGLYWASAAVEAGALGCVLTDLLNARKRAKKFRLGVSKPTTFRFNTDAAAVEESEHVVGECAGSLPTEAERLAVLEREHVEIRRQLATRTPQMVAAMLEKAQADAGAAADVFNAQVEENLQRLVKATDVTGSRWLGFLGAALLFVAIGLGLAGNLVSAHQNSDTPAPAVPRVVTPTARHSPSVTPTRPHGHHRKP